MNAADVNALPWPTIVGGAIGIAGALLGSYSNNRAAEKRRLAEQQQEDRTRFHKERVEIYARFIGAIKTYRKSLSRERSGIRDESASVNTTFSAFLDARDVLLLVASEPVRQVAEKVVDAAVALENITLSQSREVSDLEHALAIALREFVEAARAELLPARMKRPRSS